MEAWQWDANVIQLNDIDTEKLRSELVWTPQIEEFLRFGRKDHKLFVIAPKGIGKTLLLKAKSQLYRDQASGYTFIPRTDLCEKFTKLQTSFSRDEIDTVKTLELWHQTWDLALLSLILTRFQQPLPAELGRILGEASELADILRALIQNRSILSKLYELVATTLRPRVRNLTQVDGVNQVAIFIDNIDEAFEDHTGRALIYPEPGATARAAQVWINAQLGLLQAARDLCLSNKHIKIFASIRGEAYETSADALRLQTDLYCTKLRYSKAEIADIFRRNIDATPLTHLFQPSGTDPFTRFLGCVTLPHRFATNPDGSPREEATFDYLYRHTLGRPRDIVLIGDRLRLIPPQTRTPEAIRQIAHNVSTEILEQYQREIIPYFDSRVFESFCELAQHNVLPSASLEQTVTVVENQFNVSGYASYLYSLGLLGVVQTSHPSAADRIQRFLQPGYHILQEVKIPTHSDFYVLHPTVDSLLRRIHDVEFWDHKNVIGDGYPFYSPPPKLTQLRHVHIGLDRDSLSLCIPEFSRMRKVAILVPPEPEWDDLSRCDKFEFNLSNGATALTMPVVHEGLGRPEIDRRLKAWAEGRTHCLVYSSSRQILTAVFQVAQALSLTNFNDQISSLLSGMDLSRAALETVHLFARLTRPSRRQAVVRLLRASRSNATVLEGFVDRFTYEKRLSSIRQVLSIRVVCESYGELVIRSHDGHEGLLPPIVRLTSSEKEHRYLRYRHKLLLEGIYGFEKLVRNRPSKPGQRLLDAAFDLFCMIQIQRLRRSISIREIRPGIAASEIDEELMRYCASVRERLGLLDKSYAWDVATPERGRLKNAGVLPRAKDFYRYAPRSKRYVNSKAVLLLKELLGVADRKDFKSVFISYSFRDGGFASRMAEALRKRGIVTFLFEQANPKRRIQRVMVEEIKSKDRVLFIASEYSIKSRACQFELSRCREKLADLWEEVLLTVRLDNYLLTVSRDDIGDREHQDEYWGNIQFLREVYATNCAEFRRGGSSRRFEVTVDELVKECLR